MTFQHTNKKETERYPKTIAQKDTALATRLLFKQKQLHLIVFHIIKKPGNIPSIIPIPEGPLININRPPSGDISVSTLNNFCPYQTYSINLSFFSSKVASY